jgi:hypothetical protein
MPFDKVIDVETHLLSQNRRVRTPFLTTKFVLKDNVSTRKAVSAIHQLEEREKVRFCELWSFACRSSPYRGFDSTTPVTRSFSAKAPSLLSDFKPIPQGNGHLERQTKRLPMSHYGMFDSRLSLRE